MSMLTVCKVVFAALLLWCAVAANAAPKMYFVHNDHLNTPQVLTDENQNVVWRVESQSPFGEVQINEDPDNDGNDIVFNMRFPGQYYDQETGLNYNYYRTYDPSLGRYLQSDPLGLYDGPNTYAYVYGNPLMYFDFYGLQGSRGRSASAPGTLWANMTCAQRQARIATQKQIALTFATLPLGGGLANGLLNGAFKLRVAQQIGGRPASYTWGATKQWAKRNNVGAFQAGANQQRHHWLLQQNQGWGKNAPNWLKNQPWNINVVSGSFNNWMARGATNFRSLLGAPPWAKGAAASGALVPAASQLGGGNNCGCP